MRRRFQFLLDLVYFVSVLILVLGMVYIVLYFVLYFVQSAR